MVAKLASQGIECASPPRTEIRPWLMKSARSGNPLRIVDLLSA